MAGFIMDTGTTAAAAQAIRSHDQAQLISRARTIGAGLASSPSGLSASTRFKVLAAQLNAFVIELGADAAVGEHSRAIARAIDARAYDVAREACTAFALAVEGKPVDLPALLAELPTPIAPAANDNQHSANDNQHPENANIDPVRDHDVTVRDHEAEKTASTIDANCSQNREQLKPDGLGEVPARNQALAVPGQIDNIDALAAAIRTARAGKGISQQEAATAAGVGRRFVVDLEGGKATSEIGRVLAVCQAVGLAIVTVAA